MTNVLLAAGFIIAACIICDKLTEKIGIPTLLVFIGLGMLFGEDGIFKIPFENYRFAENICSAALIFIMFYGGFGTKWSEAKPVAAKAMCLSSIGVMITSALTALFCHFVLRMDLWGSVLIGAVLGSTDAASVFSILKSNKLSLKYNTDSLLEIESGSNDPFAYMMTTLALTAIQSGSLSAGTAAVMIAKNLIFGLIGGFGIAFLAVKFMKNFKFQADGFDSAFMMAVAIISYALPVYFGGNGYLSAYIVGIVLGNANLPNKKTLVHFFDGITGLVQMVIFFLLGLLATPSYLPQVFLLSIAVFAFMLLIARPAAVTAVLAPFRAKFSQIALVSWAGLRGASSIVFAIIVIIQNPNSEVFNIVFCVVLMSVAIQGMLLPKAAKKLKMIDERGNVFKTFSDYSDDEDIQFIQLEINSEHPWVGKQIKDLNIISNMLLVLIIRGDEHIIPKGDTAVAENDIIVFCALSYNGEEKISLSEETISKQHKWNNKYVSELDLKKDTLLIMIKRNEETIIPNGATLIEEGDRVVVGFPERVK
ncbi:MAG: potassium/proton antiporter [Firmicutes bacterium]|nr:potassium/proton antiporter [Bacillota bacterium]